MKESTKEMLVFLLVGIAAIVAFGGWKILALLSR